MTFLLAVCLAVVDPPTTAQSDAFRATAPEYLTRETASAHLTVARAAAAVHHVPRRLLLAIAYHESRYILTTRTDEPGGRVSCGVMTPVPKQRCTAPELTMIGGYDAGAAHLAMWLGHCGGNTYCALTAYAGGMGLVRACAFGPWLTPRGTDACDVAGDFQRLARRIP